MKTSKRLMFKKNKTKLKKKQQHFELLVIFIYFLHCWYTWKDSVASSREQ